MKRKSALLLVVIGTSFFVPPAHLRRLITIASLRYTRNRGRRWRLFRAFSCVNDASRSFVELNETCQTHEREMRRLRDLIILAIIFARATFFLAFEFPSVFSTGVLFSRPECDCESRSAPCFDASPLSFRISASGMHKSGDSDLMSFYLTTPSVRKLTGAESRYGPGRL